MVKHYSSKRASKKRAYKKRRTVRKVRNMTRKIQKGGIDGTTPIILMIIAGPFIALIGLDRIMLFLNILLILLGQPPMSMPGGQRGGLRALFNRFNLTGNLRSVSESGPTAPSGSSIKASLIANLKELQTKLVEEPEEMYGEASACLQKIIGRIEGGQINIDKPKSEPTVEPVGNISDMLKKAITAVPESQDSSMFVKIQSKITNGLEVLKEELTNKIDRLVNSIKERYNLSQDDIDCFTTLKDALLNAIIRKKEAALTKVMDNEIIKQAMSMGAEAMSMGADIKDSAGAAFGLIKSRMGNIVERIRQPSSPVASSQPVQPVKQNDEERKAALKAANIEANTAYEKAKTDRDAAVNEVTKNGMFTSNVEKQSRIDKANAARAAASAAYQKAFNAAIAAKNGRVPETEVKYPSTS